MLTNRDTAKESQTSFKDSYDPLPPIMNKKKRKGKSPKAKIRKDPLRLELEDFVNERRGM